MTDVTDKQLPLGAGVDAADVAVVPAATTIVLRGDPFEVLLMRRHERSTFVPGSYTRAVGWLMPNGPKRKNPACRSSSAPNTLGESKLGTHSQSMAPSGATSAPVWQLDRNA